MELLSAIRYGCLSRWGKAIGDNNAQRASSGDY
jgi:hypothetical protein